MAHAAVVEHLPLRRVPMPQYRTAVVGICDSCHKDGRALTRYDADDSPRSYDICVDCEP